MNIYRLIENLFLLSTNSKCTVSAFPIDLFSSREPEQDLAKYIILYIFIDYCMSEKLDYETPGRETEKDHFN